MNISKSRYKIQKANKPRHFTDFKETKVRKKQMSEELRNKLQQKIELYTQRAKKGLPLFEKKKQKKK